MAESPQELHSNQEAVMTDFDDEGFSATVKFTSPDADDGSMTSHLVRGMVSRSYWDTRRSDMVCNFNLSR